MGCVLGSRIKLSDPAQEALAKPDMAVGCSGDQVRLRAQGGIDEVVSGTDHREIFPVFRRGDFNYTYSRNTFAVFSKPDIPFRIERNAVGMAVCGPRPDRRINFWRFRIEEANTVAV